VVRFDNTYSWARGKKIHYLIEVLEPESQNGDDNLSNQKSEDSCSTNDNEEEEFVMANENT